MNIAGPAVTLTTFTIISAVKGSGTLLAAPAFTSIAVLALIGTPLITLFQGLPLIKSAIGSMARIQEFLAQRGHQDSRIIQAPANKGQTETSTQPGLNHSQIEMAVLKSVCPEREERNIEIVVTMSAASIRLPDIDDIVLRDLDLAITRGSLAMIIGPVGCGKSTLVKAILGETMITKGAISVSFGDIAFCDQSPWLTFGTIRENITAIAETPFDEAWYATVLHACALEQDLEQLPDRDQSVVGSKGLALSGGQRQRVVSVAIQLLDFFLCTAHSKTVVNC